jgi:hypothetical protein
MAVKIYRISVLVIVDFHSFGVDGFFLIREMISYCALTVKGKFKK